MSAMEVWGSPREGWSIKRVALVGQSGYEVGNLRLFQVELHYRQPEWHEDEYIRVEVTVDSMENLNSTVPLLVWAEQMKRGTRVAISREKLPVAVADHRRARTGVHV
jgi:hypothetical protein